MDTVKKKPVGRFAPTPSGRMHLGNIFSAMIGYLSAKSRGGDYLLRIEDLDPLRCPRSAAEQIMSDLEYFGFEFDGNIIWQSERTEIYEKYLDKLRNKGLLYPCFCSRAALHVSSAPHGDTPVYSGKCRGLKKEDYPKRSGATRVTVPDIAVETRDLLQGDYSQNLASDCGDFIVRRSDGIFAYQLAVVVDDGESGVTEIVRGKDLLSSAPRQLYLFDLFGFPRPDFLHVPLIYDGDGERMSKRLGKSNMEYIRTAFPDPRPIIGMLAFNAGVIDRYEPLLLKELVPLFDRRRLKADDIIIDACGLF